MTTLFAIICLLIVVIVLIMMFSWAFNGDTFAIIWLMMGGASDLLQICGGLLEIIGEGLSSIGDSIGGD